MLRIEWLVFSLGLVYALRQCPSTRNLLRRPPGLRANAWSYVQYRIVDRHGTVGSRRMLRKNGLAIISGHVMVLFSGDGGLYAHAADPRILLQGRKVGYNGLGVWYPDREQQHVRAC